MDANYTKSRIAEIMNEKGVRQVDLANAIGVSQVTVSHWFGGASTSYMLYLDKIAKYFHVSMDYLVGNNTVGPLYDDEANEYLFELKNRPEMRQLFKVSKGATKEDIQRAIEIVKALKKQSGYND